MFVRFVKKMKKYSRGTWITQIILIILLLIAALVNYIIYMNESSKVINDSTSQFSISVSTIMKNDLLKYSLIGWGSALGVVLIIAFIFWVLFLVQGFKLSAFQEYDMFKDAKKIKACAGFGVLFSFVTSMFAEKYSNQLMYEIKKQQSDSQYKNNYGSEQYTYDKFNNRHPYEEHFAEHDMYYYDDNQNTTPFICIDQTSVKRGNKRKK